MTSSRQFRLSENLVIDPFDQPEPAKLGFPGMCLKIHGPDGEKSGTALLKNLFDLRGRATTTFVHKTNPAGERPPLDEIGGGCVNLISGYVLEFRFSSLAGPFAEGDFSTTELADFFI